MIRRPRVAVLRGALLSPFEMQSFAALEKEFDLTAFTPHRTNFDLSGVGIRRQSLWCPLEAGRPFQDTVRDLHAFNDRLTGRAGSFCGLSDLLRGFDLIHVADQYYCYCLEAVLAKRRWGGRILVTQWENIPHLNERKHFNRHTKRVIREEADLFIAMSDGAEKVLLGEGVPPERIARARGAVDTAHFRPGPPDMKLKSGLGFEPRDRLVMYAGRLAREKGVFTLLDAAQRLKDASPGVRFLLVGRDEDGVSHFIGSRGLSGSVRLAGFVPYEDMDAYYRLAGLFVLPSLDRKGWKEQFGYVLAEAMACGVPVAGSDSGAIPEVVGDPSRVFPQGDGAALADLVRRFYSRPRGLQAAAARKRALRLYSTQVLSATLARLYHRALTLPSRVGPRPS